MATVASPPAGQGTPRQHQGTQKRLLRSISRFLSGGKNRPKLSSNDARTTSLAAPRIVGDQDGQRGGIPLGEVRSTTRSMSTGETASTSVQDEDDDDRDSLSRLSAVSGADTDASLRPISPSSVGPASSVISRTDSASNASFAPTHGTFKSYASTKPTTLSLDSGVGGANRIAVVPGTGHPASTAPLHGHSHLLPTSSSGGSLGAQPHTPSSLSGPGITFSTLPSSTSSTPLGSPTTPTTPAPTSADTGAELEGSQVPRHTLAHPRNNPHPASPPPDNASMLTLASSSFAPSFSLSRASGGGGAGPSGGASWGGGGLTGLRAWRKGDEGGADEDASVRVLAGSRRASDESLGGKSTWSAAIGRSFPAGVGGVREGSAGGRASSVRTVGTSGTGGDLLGQEREGDAGEGDKRRESVQGETEAQKVVRKEGAKDDLEAEAAASAAHPLDTPTNLTPTTELDSKDGSPNLSSVRAANEDDLDPEATPNISSSTSGSMPPPPVPHAARAEPLEEGAKTPKRTGAGGRSLGGVSGTETDAQSFVDAASQLGEGEEAGEGRA